jgi:excisionase family DNA binding protein
MIEVVMPASFNNPISEIHFLTIAEVAAIIRVSRMTVYRLVHNGELPAIRVGRSFRIPQQAVNEYLQEAFIAVS